jgi:hypothetical protein
MGNTYRFLSDFSNVVGNPDTLWVFLEELLGSSGVHIMYKECVFRWDFCPEVSCHGVTWKRR